MARGPLSAIRSSRRYPPRNALMHQRERDVSAGELPSRTCAPGLQSDCHASGRHDRRAARRVGRTLSRCQSAHQRVRRQAPLPRALYHQHQRIVTGMQVSDCSLMSWSSSAIGLLEPIYVAPFSHMLQRRVFAMNKTPTRYRSTPMSQPASSAWMSTCIWSMSCCASASISGKTSSASHNVFVKRSSATIPCDQTSLPRIINGLIWTVA